jgi:hypothetical protein
MTFEHPPRVGDGATIRHHSDQTACTIIRVSPSGKTIHLEEDEAMLDDWKLDFVPGGFAAHCLNNASQRYIYRPDAGGTVHVARLCKDGRFRTRNREVVVPGYHHFHNYNF